MLQRSNAELIVNSAEPASSEQGGLRELVDFAFGLLRRQYLVILFLTLLAAGGRCNLSSRHPSDLHRQCADHYWDAKRSIHPTTINVH